MTRRSSPIVVDLVLLGALVGLAARGWLSPGLPGEDFPGGAAWLYGLKEAIAAQGRIPLWMPQWFNGGSYVLIRSGLLNLLVPLPLLYLFDVVASLKLAMVLFQWLAALSMYLLVWSLWRSRPAAFASAAVYSLSPIYIMETALHGHMSVSMFYAFMPLGFLLYLKALDSRRILMPLLCGLFLAGMLWFDNERTMITAPFWLVLLGAHVIREGTKRPGGIVPAVASGVARSLLVVATAVLADAFIILPFFAESRYHYLFSSETLKQSIGFFALLNPLYVIDRNGFLTSDIARFLPREMSAFSGLLYLGAAPIALTIAGAVMILRRKDDAAAWLYLGFLLFVPLGMALAAGPYSLGGRLSLLPSSLLRSDEFVDSHAVFLIVSFILVIAGIFVAVRNREAALQWVLAHPKVTLAVIAAALSLLFAKPFMLLRSAVPIYERMRNPLGFLLAAPLVGLAVGVGGFLHGVRHHLKKRLDYFALAFLPVLGLVVWDCWPYSRYYREQMPARVVQEPKRLFAEENWQEPYRAISIESYNPLSDMALVYAGVPAAWAWLNWDSPKHTGELIFEGLYPRLWNPASRETASRYAGLASIKYILDEEGETPSFGASEGFVAGPAGRYFGIYRNEGFKPFVQLYGTSLLYVGSKGGAFTLLDKTAGSDTALICMDLVELEAAGGSGLELYKAVYFENEDELEEAIGLYPELASKAQLLHEADLAGVAAEGGGESSGEVLSWKRRSATEVSIDVEAQAPITLVISESCYPGWHVYVDGVEHELLLANWAFQGVQLEPGQREVRFSYRAPWYFPLGTGVSLAALAGVLSVIAVDLARARRNTIAELAASASRRKERAFKE